MTDEATILESTPEDAQPNPEELLRELQRQEAEQSVIPVPITIVAENCEFSTDPEAGPQAAYIGESGSLGILATGTFADNGEAKDVIFPWHSIVYVELHGERADEGTSD